jgi:hypothetical protein
VRRLLQRELQVVAQVCAAEHGRAVAAPATENLAEDVAEDVAETAHAAGGAGGMRVDAGMAELVVGGALLPVGQHLVGFLRLLEVLLGLGVVRIAIRMPLHGELAIRALEIGVARVAIDAKNLVVVALRQAISPSSCPLPR